MTKNKLVLILAGSVLLLLSTGMNPAPTAEPESAGPGVVQLDRLEGPYGPVTFDHARHATRYADGCGDCHHQHSGYDKNPCKRCHEIDAAQFKASVTRNFPPCGKCHGDYDPAAPDVPDLKVAYHQQCFGCHRKLGDVGKAPENCEQLCHTKKK